MTPSGISTQQDATCIRQRTLRSRWTQFEDFILTRVVTSLTPYLRPLVRGLVRGRHGERYGGPTGFEDV